MGSYVEVQLCALYTVHNTHTRLTNSHVWFTFSNTLTSNSLPIPWSKQRRKKLRERERDLSEWVKVKSGWLWCIFVICRRLSISVASSVLFGVLGGGSDHMWTRVSRPSGAKGCQILILNDGMSAERFVTPVSWLTNMTCHFCRCEFRMFRISSLLRIMLCDL